MSDFVDIDHQLASITRGKDKKNDALMLMTPEYNWGRFLQPAPFAIAILGELLLVSPDTDFKLIPPAGGFKHVGYADSFRSSIIQVTNLGWTCFNTAHTNMDQIRLLCGNVDGHLVTAVKFLLHGSRVEVEHILPMSLGKISHIASECFTLASQTQDKFQEMMDLIAELLESSSTVKGVTEDKKKENERSIKVAKMEKDRLQKDIGDSKERLKRMEKEVQEAQTEFKNAINSIPTGGELLGLAAGEACVNCLRSILNSAGKAASAKMEQAAGIPSTPGVQPTNAGGYSTSGNSTAVLDEQMSRQHIYNRVQSLKTYFSSLYNLTTRRPAPDWNKVKTDAPFLQKQFELIVKNVQMEKHAATLRNRVSQLCNDCIAICTELLENTRKLSPENEKSVVQKLVSKVQAMQRDTETLHAESKRELGSNPLDSKSPHLSQLKPPKEEGKSIVDKTIENARYKTEVAKETLRDAKRREEKSYDELKEKNENLTKILEDMEKLKMDDIDFESIRKALIKGINALADLRTRWGQLVQFFQLLTNIIKCCLSTSLNEFVDEAKIARTIKIGSQTMSISDVLRDNIFEQASKCSQIAFVVYTVSNAYVQISDKHLMDKVTNLSLLISLDPKTQKQKIISERSKLTSDCKAAQNDIAHLVAQEKAAFMADVGNRIKQIQNIEKEFPAIDKKREEEIKTSVSQAFDSTPTDDYAGPSAEDLI